jgi:membrane protease YdiL (CAAX protease family)
MLTLNNKSDVTNTSSASDVWGPWPTVGFGITIFAVYTLIQSLVILIFIVVSLASDPTLSILQVVQDVSSSGLAVSLSLYPSTAAGVGLIFLFVKVRKSINVREYLEFKPVTRKTFLVLLSITLVLTVLTELASVFFEFPDSQFVIDIYKKSVWPVVLWIAMVIFAPVFEETFFRGFLFVGLKQSWLGSGGTIALTALLWALLHIQYDVYGMLTVVILGIILGVARLKTGSLWSPILIHSFWNFLAMVITALYMNGIIS